MATPTPVKPGWQTTEFWLAAVVEVIGLLLASGVVTLGDESTIARVIGAAIAVLAAFGYTVSRTKLKSK